MQPKDRTHPDSVWLITGAASGFGNAVASAALARGDRVAALDVDGAPIDELARTYDRRVLALACDVADNAAVRRAVQQTVEHFGRIYFVFNNAGYGHVGAAEELSDAELHRQIDVNLFGNINVVRAVLPYLRRQRSGHLLQMSSLNGVEGLAGGSYYAASKFAIEGFSESLAHEIAPFGIKITIIEPGPFRTRFLDDKSARWAAPMTEYAETVGNARAMLSALNGRQPGDPARAAQSILSVVDAPEPPRRLVLGRMAVEHIRATLEGRLEELDRWAQPGADFPSAAQEREARGNAKSEQTHEDLVRRAYSAFNGRAIDAALELLSPDVDWPKVPDGGFVHGRENVARHWREQFAKADPRVEVDDIAEPSTDRVEANVHQIVRDFGGRTLSNERLLHVFTIANERIKRLEVRARP